VTHPYDYGERADVFALLPKECRSVLDVGTSLGGFCALVKRRRPQVSVWGIESDAAAAEAAGEHADHVVCGRFPQDMPRDALRFDAICFNDVLEHMLDPGEALTAAGSYLSEGGVVLASIPNIRHWQMVKHVLIGGNFTYTDTGLFDRTHLRFFTRASMLDLFEKAGYEVDVCVPSSVSGGWKARLLRWAARGAGTELTSLHFIIRARPAVRAPR
jgi:2-polyprenyl-3-methyl-5-hydroxy-6-metoxy-1,4-benzoquinol methylase